MTNDDCRCSGLWDNASSFSEGEVIKLTDIKDFSLPLILVFVICVCYYVAVFPFIGLGKWVSPTIPVITVMSAESYQRGGWFFAVNFPPSDTVYLDWLSYILGYSGRFELQVQHWFTTLSSWRNTFKLLFLSVHQEAACWGGGCALSVCLRQILPGWVRVQGGPLLVSPASLHSLLRRESAYGGCAFVSL